MSKTIADPARQTVLDVVSELQQRPGLAGFAAATQVVAKALHQAQAAALKGRPHTCDAATDLVNDWMDHGPDSDLGGEAIGDLIARVDVALSAAHAAGWEAGRERAATECYTVYARCEGWQDRELLTQATDAIRALKGSEDAHRT